MNLDPGGAIRIQVIALLLTLCLGAEASAQLVIAPDNGGNGSDGAFMAPLGNTTLDTNIQATYNFTMA